MTLATKNDTPDDCCCIDYPSLVVWRASAFWRAKPNASIDAPAPRHIPEIKDCTLSFAISGNATPEDHGVLAVEHVDNLAREGKMFVSLYVDGPGRLKRGHQKHRNVRHQDGETALGYVAQRAVDYPSGR